VSSPHVVYFTFDKQAKLTFLLDGSIHRATSSFFGVAIGAVIPLPLSNVFDPKEFEIILGNNLPKGTLKLHNTINSIDVSTSM
jgi:hypothetical protein